MTDNKPVAEYDTNDVDIEHYREAYIEPNISSSTHPDTDLSDDEVREKAFADTRYWERKQEDFEDTIGWLLREISKRNDEKGYYVVTTNNAGWRDSRGGKVIDVSEHDLTEYMSAERKKAGRKFLRPFINNLGNYRIEVFRDRNKLRIVLYHHDSPTGETYRARPLRKEEVRKYKSHGEDEILKPHKETGVHP